MTKAKYTSATLAIEKFDNSEGAAIVGIDDDGNEWALAKHPGDGTLWLIRLEDGGPHFKPMLYVDQRFAHGLARVLAAYANAIACDPGPELKA